MSLLNLHMSSKTLKGLGIISKSMSTCFAVFVIVYVQVSMTNYLKRITHHSPKTMTKSYKQNINMKT